MSKYLTQVDGGAYEVHFARDTIVVPPFSVTTPGWHSAKLLTKYGSAYANSGEVMIRSEAIVWSRHLEVSRWFEIDHENLIPTNSADKVQAVRVVTHLSHSPAYGDDDDCGVIPRQVSGYGWVYRLLNDEEE